MSTISVTNVKHESSTPNNIVLTSDGDIQIARALGLGGATYGTSGQVLTSAGSGAVPTWATATNLTRGTAAATTSGTEVDFTTLPSGIRKITLVLDSVSINTTDNVFVRLSTGGTFATTGYESQSMRIQNASTSAAVTDTTQFVIISNDNASRLWTGSFTWHNITGNTWVMSGNCNTDGDARAVVCSGRIALGGTLDGLRMRTAGTYDGGQINIFYEV